MWHSMPRANEDDAPGAHRPVQLVAVDGEGQARQPGRATTTRSPKYKAGLTSGDLPDVVQLQGTDQQQMIDTQTVLPAEACAKADKYSFADFLPRVLELLHGARQVVRDAVQHVGPGALLQQEGVHEGRPRPREAADDARRGAQLPPRRSRPRARCSGAPLGLKVDPGFLEHWRAMANKLYVNNGNGRKARATKVVFNDATGRELFAWMNGMVKDGLAETNPDSGTQPVRQPPRHRQRQRTRWRSTRARSLGTITQVLASGAVPRRVDSASARCPARAGTGGVLVQGGALFMVNKSRPAKQAAAWQYLKFLDTPESQATWAVGTGYVPIVKKAAALPAVKDFWAAEPRLQGGVRPAPEGCEHAPPPRDR